MEGVQIWDDQPWRKPMTTEQANRIKASFDELVASGKIKVLTVETSIGRVTFITQGEVPLADREGDI